MVIVHSYVTNYQEGISFHKKLIHLDLGGNLTITILVTQRFTFWSCGRQVQGLPYVSMDGQEYAIEVPAGVGCHEKSLTPRCLLGDFWPLEHL